MAAALHQSSLGRLVTQHQFEADLEEMQFSRNDCPGGGQLDRRSVGAAGGSLVEQQLGPGTLPFPVVRTGNVDVVFQDSEGDVCEREHGRPFFEMSAGYLLSTSEGDVAVQATVHDQTTRSQDVVRAAIACEDVLGRQRGISDNMDVIRSHGAEAANDHGVFDFFPGDGFLQAVEDVRLVFEADHYDSLQVASGGDDVGRLGEQEGSGEEEGSDHFASVSGAAGCW